MADLPQEAGSREHPRVRRVSWSFLGRVPYLEAVALQERLRDRLAAGEGEEHLLLLEHPHTYTLGRNASEADLLMASSALRERGIEVAHTNRGGQVTYHGPGQLVGYPIVDLDPDRRDVRRYVEDLMTTLVRVLDEYGVEARPAAPGEPVGVWVGSRKIASLGVHLKRWLTTHGFALNVTTDLSLFAGIVACGLPGVELASIETETGRRPALEEVAERYALRFGERFERRMRRVPASELLGEAACSAS